MTTPEKAGPPRVEFCGAFPLVFSATMSLLGVAPSYEGFDQWVYVTYAGLSDDLRKDIQVLLKPIWTPLVMGAYLRGDELPQDYSSFIGWLTVLEDELVVETVERVLREYGDKTGGPDGDPVAAPSPADEAALRRFTAATQCSWGRLPESDEASFDQLIGLLRNPEDLRARLVFTATRFWERHFREAYEGCRAMIERSVNAHRARNYAGDLATTLLAVTGRAPSETFLEELADLETLLFVPSCFTGPYIQYAPFEPDDRRAMMLIYNCRPLGGRENHPSLAIREMFPPLRALADETRLEILAILADGELYAQQIVDQLDITQPAVSRHLRLMVAGGILTERKETGMKFYSIRRDTLTDLAKRIAGFTGWGSD